MKMEGRVEEVVEGGEERGGRCGGGVTEGWGARWRRGWGSSGDTRQQNTKVGFLAKTICIRS